jgi:hypothetical protein
MIKNKPQKFLSQMELVTVQDFITWAEQGMERLQLLNEKKDHLWNKYLKIIKLPQINSIFSPDSNMLNKGMNTKTHLELNNQTAIQHLLNGEKPEELINKLDQDLQQIKSKKFTSSPYEWVNQDLMEQRTENQFFDCPEKTRPVRFISIVKSYNLFASRLYQHISYFNDFTQIKKKIDEDYNFFVFVKTDQTLINFLCECNCREPDFQSKLHKLTKTLICIKEKIQALDTQLSNRKKLIERGLFIPPKETQNPENPEIENPENSQIENQESSNYEEEEEEEDFVFTEEEETYTEKSEIENPENPQIETQQETQNEIQNEIQQQTQNSHSMKPKKKIEKIEPTIAPLTIPIIKETQKESDDDLFGSQSGAKTHYIIPSVKLPKKDDEEEPEQF